MHLDADFLLQYTHIFYFEPISTAGELNNTFYFKEAYSEKWFCGSFLFILLPACTET